MKSFQVTEFNAPLKEVDAADAAAVGHPGADQGQGRRRLPQRPAYLGRRLRSRPWPQAAVAEGPRRVAAADHGPRDRRRGRGVRTRREGRRQGRSQGRRRRAGLSLARLRQVRDLPRRRREHVRRQAERARRLLRRRLCRSHDGAASEISAESEGARSRHRGALRLFRRHHLQRAEEGRDSPSTRRS